MTKIPTGSFIKRIRQSLFRWRADREIFEKIFPHLRRAKDCGYSFLSDHEMNRQTEEFGVQGLLDTIERQIRRMPKAYGESFRHVMHRDLHARLIKYENAGRRRIQPHSIASHFVATRA